MKPLPLVLPALAVIAGLAIAAPQAQAQTAARVESQIRPNFGLLLEPPTQARQTARTRTWNPRWRPPVGPNPPPAPPRGGGEAVVLLDCGGNGGSGGLEAAVDRLRDGGTLVINTRVGECTGVIDLDKSITIIGDANMDLRAWNRGQRRPTLSAPEGAPCLVVRSGVRVTVRDVVFNSGGNGSVPCVLNYGGTILFDHVGLRHTGAAPAISAEGGTTDLSHTAIEAHTDAAAILVDRGTLRTADVMIEAARSGIEITTGEGPQSEIRRTRLLGGAREVIYGQRPVGLLVQATRELDAVEVSDSRICGYPDAVVVEGGKLTLEQVRICKTDVGVTLYGGQATVNSSRIVANEIGVLSVGGFASVDTLVVANVGRAPLLEQRGGRIDYQNVRVWSAVWDGCRVRYQRRYGNRYSPVWDPGDGYFCEVQPYPGQWWAEDEQRLGVPYDYRVDYPQQYSYFSGGEGWYDCEQNYVYDRRYRGDDRWRGPGREGWTRQCDRRSAPPIGASAFRPYSGPEIDFRSGFRADYDH